MKKFIALILLVVMSFSAFGASAASVPKFMDKIYENYTADYRLSLTIDNADEIVAFLHECEIPAQVTNSIDIEALLTSICAVDSVMNVQAEFSNDFRKMKVALTTETKQDIKLNRNFESAYLSKTGMWLEMDIDKKELVIIYSTPLNEKYAVLDFAKDVPAEVSEMVFGMYDKVFNREYMEKTSHEIMTLAAKHADISLSGNTCIVRYSNDSFVALIEDTADYIKKMVSDMIPATDEDFEFEIPSMKGIKLLGKDGIVCTYKLNGNNIKSLTEKWDISIGLAEIFKKVTGTEWNYEFDGNLDFSLECRADVSKIGTTHPQLPDITENNSFSIADKYFPTPYNEYEYENYEESFYKSYYAFGNSDKEIYENGRYYVPVRACIEDAYWGCSDIAYENGTVTINTYCDTPEDNIRVTFTVGEDCAVVNGVYYEGFGEFIVADSTVYASVDFFEKCLGWSLYTLTKDLIDGSISYEFETFPYEY